MQQREGIKALETLRDALRDYDDDAMGVMVLNEQCDYFADILDAAIHTIRQMQDLLPPQRLN